MLHLHRLQHHQGLPPAHFVAGRDHHPNDLARHRCRQATGRAGAFRCFLDRDHTLEVDLGAIGGGKEDVSLPICPPTAMLIAHPDCAPVRRLKHNLPRVVECDDRDLRLTIAKDQRFPVPQIYPPAVGRGPGRVRLAACVRARRRRLPARIENTSADRCDGAIGDAVASRHQGARMAADEPGVDRAGHERRMANGPTQECLIGHRPHADKFGQQAVERCDRGVPVSAVGDDLGDHRIVGNGDIVARPHAGIDPNRTAHFRRLKRDHMARRGQEIARRVFRIEPGLDGMPVQADI